MHPFAIHSSLVIEAYISEEERSELKKQITQKYREENKDIIIERERKYREENRTKIAEENIK